MDMDSSLLSTIYLMMAGNSNTDTNTALKYENQIVIVLLISHFYSNGILYRDSVLINILESNMQNLPVKRSQQTT